MASSFSADNFLTIPVKIIDNNNLQFITKVWLKDTHGTYNDILGFTNADAPVGFNSNRYLGMYNTSSWVVGSTQYDLNKDIWVKFTWDGTAYKVYGMYDDNYHIENLPDRWTLNATWTTTTKLFTSDTIRIGNTVKTTTEYFGGYIDLTNTRLLKDNKLYWSAIFGILV